jgi:hypothetical protein
MAALRAARLNGDFEIFDLRSGKVIEGRGAAGNNNHVDFQYKNRNAFVIVLTLLRLALTALVGNWNPRPGILRFTNSTGTYAFAIAYHTFNHSIRVASNAYDIVFPFITRLTERLASGAWAIGHHLCMWTGDSYALRGNRTATWERQMRDAVLEAERWAGAQAIPITPPAAKVVNYRVQVTVETTLRVRAAPNNTSTILESLRNGTELTIVRESPGAGALLWGQIKSSDSKINGGWVALDHTRQLDLVQAQPTTPTPPPADVWRVQIGAFRERAGAERTVDAAIAAGYYAYLNSYGGWYRAQIGAETARAAADNIARRLEADTALARKLHLPKVNTLVKVA